MAETAPVLDGSSAFNMANAMWTSSDRALELIRVTLGAREYPIGRTPKEVIWRKNKSRLYRYVRSTPPTKRTPVFLCMPLINRADILDLRPGGSFVEFLLEEGFDVFMYDWGIWGPEDRNVSIADLLVRYLPRAVREANRAAGAEMTMLGYCIGGTLAVCFAALYSDAPIKNLVLFTTPVDFEESGDFGVWTAKGAFPVEKIREVLPTVPGDLIDVGSKMLNPVVNYLGTYVKLWEKLGDPSFDVQGWQAMNRWVNEGTPFPGKAYYEWITEFYQENKLAKGAFHVEGRRVDLSQIRWPLLSVAASADTIAPRTTTEPILELAGSEDEEEFLLKGGHVGIVVGRSARGNLWPRVAAWLTRHD